MAEFDPIMEKHLEVKIFKSITKDIELKMSW